MNAVVWSAVTLAGVVALLVPTLLRPSLTCLGVLDLPNHRSSHTNPTLRGGGVAPLLGFILGAILVTIVLPRDSMLIPTAVLSAAVLVGFIGLVEDLRGLPVVVRAGSQIAIGGGLALILTWALGISWVWVPIAAIAFAAEVNFVNFMDGVNGISSLHGLVAGLAFATLGWLQEVPWLTTVGLITALAFIAFLPWNLSPPGMFLGDVGSYLLGGALGATAISALAIGLNPVAAVAPLTIYWADTIVTLLRRLNRREPLHKPHRSHVYQRLTDRGHSHMAVAGIVASFTVGTSVIGLLTAVSTIPWRMAITLILVLSAWYLVLPQMPRSRFSPQATSDQLLRNI